MERKFTDDEWKEYEKEISQYEKVSDDYYDEIIMDRYRPSWMRTKEFENELAFRTKLMMEKIKEIKNKYPVSNRNDVLGDIGEELFDNIQCVLNNLYYTSKYDGRCSYKIKRRYGAPSGSPRGGIDFYIDLKDEGEYLYTLAIEVKNWDTYSNISENMWKTEIKDRYKVCEGHEIKVLAITKGNVLLVKKRCEYEDIDIIPLKYFLDPQIDKNKISEVLFALFWDFHMLIEDKIYSDIIGRMRRYRGLGIPVKNIAEIFRCSPSWVYRNTKKSS